MIARIAKKLLREVCRLDSRLFVWYLRRQGCHVGVRTKFHGRKNVDLTRPWLISIGDDVTITDDVMFLAHSHDWSVLRNYYRNPMIIGSAGKVTVGNNVFIGSRTIVCMGVSVGDNCIIGAGSIVTQDIPSNSVAYGAPARVVKSLEEHYFQRKARITDECIQYTKDLRSRGVVIDESKYWEFFPLFKSRHESLSKAQIRQLGLSAEAYSTTGPVWDGIGTLIQCAEADDSDPESGQVKRGK